MGYKFTSICCNGASLTTVHEPEDHGVSIAPSPLFSSRHVSEIHLGLIKLLLASLLWQSKYPLLSQHPQRWTKRPCPAASLGSFIRLQQVQRQQRAYPLTLFPEDFQHTQTSVPHRWHRARQVRRQHGWRTLMPGHPVPCRALWGGLCNHGESQGQTAGYVWGQREDTQPHPWDVSELVKRACCRHGVSGDSVDPISKTFIACLGHL